MSLLMENIVKVAQRLDGLTRHPPHPNGEVILTPILGASFLLQPVSGPMVSKILQPF